MIALHLAAALFAIYMLVRHAPRLVLAVRARRTGDRPGLAVAALNVALALLILVAAVKALAGALI